MTNVIERGLRTSPPRGPHGSDGFATSSTTPCIESKKAATVATRSGRAADATRVGVREIDRLYRAFADVTPENHPRTARLLASSTRRSAQKVIEEAGEVALEAVRHSRSGIIRESADLLYHLVALWHRAGIDPDDVWTEMHRRVELLGIAEKLPKKRNGNAKREPAVQADDVSRATNAE